MNLCNCINESDNPTLYLSVHILTFSNTRILSQAIKSEVEEGSQIRWG